MKTATAAVMAAEELVPAAANSTQYPKECGTRRQQGTARQVLGKTEGRGRLFYQAALLSYSRVDTVPESLSESSLYTKDSA